MKKKVLLIFGTRPEAIKMFSVCKAFKAKSDIFETKICVTAQHREMLDQVMELFQMKPDYDLNVMRRDQTLSGVTSKILLDLQIVFEDFNPDLVMVQGDTTSAFVGSLAAFYSKIMVGHIEAGLRTYNKYSPWPEEINRQLISKLAGFHFCPTEVSRKNLLREGIDDDCIFVSGNTVIDSLFFVLSRIKAERKLRLDIKQSLMESGYCPQSDKKFVLITGHRRESHGQGFMNICSAISRLSKNYCDIDFVYPVHMNPNVRKPVNDILDGLQNVFLMDPLKYEQFIYMMSESYLILTDSGGIQEEAPSMGKPVLVMRDTTERPEAVEAGTVRLVGTNTDRIVSEVSTLLGDELVYSSMAEAINPYGDGNSGLNIVDWLVNQFS
jgi:UDP-N-acetylglucosamine 2-epimerase (non-hydrolysing)